MPRFRKLSPTEIPANTPTPSARAQVAQAYDALLADFALGEYGRAELVADERRDTVRSRLHAAARRRGLALRFRPGPGPLIFCIDAAPITPTMVETDSIPDRASPQRRVTQRRRREERRPAGRYNDVLPRWMRAGQTSGQRGEGKRRGR